MLEGEAVGGKGTGGGGTPQRESTSPFYVLRGRRRRLGEKRALLIGATHSVPLSWFPIRFLDNVLPV